MPPREASTLPIPNPPAVHLTGLRYSFGPTTAVDGLDLSLTPGEIFGLLGPNGAGKTTTIRAMTTLLPVPAGTIRIGGRDCTREKMAVRRLIGYLPQQRSADPKLTGRQNVALFARIFDVPRGELADQVTRTLAAVDLNDVGDRLAGTYSGGMLRRLELAQALVSSPRLLVLDEPTLGLDPVARAAIWDHIRDMRARTGMTVLVTTHYMDEAEQHCDRIGLMHRGRLCAIGTPRQLKDRVEAVTATRPDRPPTLEDVYRHYASADWNTAETDHVPPTRTDDPAPPAQNTLPATELPAHRPRNPLGVLASRTGAICLAELQKLIHDRSEFYSRAVQPLLWLLVFGQAFTRFHRIPTGDVPYLDYLAPGIIAQSAMSSAIFFGLALIWERDAGIFVKLLATPTPRSVLMGGRALAAGVKALAQAVLVLAIAALLGVSLTANPLKLLTAALVVVLASMFFSSLSMAVAALVKTGGRLVGLNQALTTVLFFCSSALYPTGSMPGWLHAISTVNPLSHEADALRSLLLGLPGHLLLNLTVLALATAAATTVAAALVGRLSR